MTRDGRRTQGVAAGCRSHCIGELARSHVLEEKTTSAGPQCFVYVLAAVEGGENDNARRVRKFQQAPRGFDSITDWHSNVYQRHVRLETAGQFDRLEPI